MTPRNTVPVTAAETVTSFAAHWTSTAVATLSLLLLAALASGCLIWPGARKLTNRQRRGTTARWVAAVAAVGCTAYSASTSWQFASDYLDMHNTVERCAFFATGELAMAAGAVMARHNLHGPQQEAGTAGVLVWVLAAVLSIPAYAEFGPVGGTVAACYGPVMAAALWRQAVGLDQPRRSIDTASHGMRALLLARPRHRRAEPEKESAVP
jgi:hypothetical protein